MKKPEEGNSNNSPMISEKTLLPISLILVLLAGVVRVESTSFKAQANEDKIRVLEDKNNKLTEVIFDIRNSLTRIETKFEHVKIEKQEHIKE